MRSVLCLLLFIFSPSVFARTLTPVSRLSIKERAAIARATTASFTYRFDPGVNCTGTFISEKGYFLTALHCLSACLIKQKAVAKSPATDDPLNLPDGRHSHLYLMTVNEDRIDEGVECSGRLNGKAFTATVVMTGGKGWMTPKDRVAAFSKQNPDEYRRLLDDGYEHGFDFAILKTTSANGCLPLTSEAPKANDRLRAVPYACVERDEFRSNGKMALFTEGVRTSGFTKSELFKIRGPASLDFDPSLLDRNDTFFSSLDLEKCGSGTGIFDTQDRVIGVASRVYKSSTGYEYGSLEAVSASRILREINQKLNTSVAKDVLSCASPSRNPSPALAPRTKGQTQARSSG